MIEITNTEVFGWETAIRGMRNPLNSWEKSDSHINYNLSFFEPEFIIGENDLKLMQTLSKAGNDHAKYLRMINVTCDIKAPLYWWKEYDTYKVGTVANSCSTMHKIHAKEFTLDDFSHEHLRVAAKNVLIKTIEVLNAEREAFIGEVNETLKGDRQCWYSMIQLLPTSYNQLRTVQLNYQVLKSMYHARKNHKLDEWREFCKWVETLPYFKEICIEMG